ncbi:hypothetical protein AJ80_05036 [Polytolypa hystricis UAMH7299]|uniref:SWIRM domain-containing protein n=1 Tax=Polytolypa hystricis (strain UAMH7299) TaxID=1447883 RepID=A0A2B7Y7N6_POLH7|nr:hypothetical protein AJ80_05036 [Polytolypa hystricis UAMH7299]
MNRLPPVSSLMSPPEAKPYDSFPSSSSSLSPSASDQHQHQHQHQRHHPILPPPSALLADRKRSQSEMDLPSPPVTPYVGHKKRRSDDATHVDKDDDLAATRDPVLFPRDDASVQAILNDDLPLFGPAQAPAAEALVEKHMASHMSRFDNKLNKPTREEYLFALSCVPVVSTKYNQNPGLWARQERDILDRQLAMMNKYRQPLTPTTTNGNLKRLAPAPSTRRSHATTAASGSRSAPKPRARRTPRSTPRERPLDSFEGTTSTASATPKPARVIGTNKDEAHYKDIPDFCPPLSTLRGNTKGLKADWKGQMLDLSNDPDRSQLDPAEITLAATLRLSCGTYLCSKRRIFEARVHALRIGKEFRKTDAQQACKIDVNKASKLWTAYDKVGWFNPKYFEEYL